MGGFAPFLWKKEVDLEGLVEEPARSEELLVLEDSRVFLVDPVVEEPSQGEETVTDSIPPPTLSFFEGG